MTSDELRALVEKFRQAPTIGQAHGRAVELVAMIPALLSRAETAEARIKELEGERDGLKARADDLFKRVRNAMDTSYWLQYPVAPEVLEWAADEVDCGGDCETAWREHDTNATGCTKSETDGCPFEMAANLREFAKALRSQKAESVNWIARLQASEADKARVLALLTGLIAAARGPAHLVDGYDALRLSVDDAEAAITTRQAFCGDRP